MKTYETIILILIIVLAFTGFLLFLNSFYLHPYKNAPYKGNENAPVTIVEIGSYSCGATASAEATMEELFKKYGEKLKLIYLDYPMSDTSWKAAEAAECALEQDKFWEYHNLLFERQDEWKLNTIRFEIYASELGLNTTNFNKCLNEEKYKQKIEQNIEYAKFKGVNALPTFFINNVKMERAQSFETFSKAIDFLLK